MPHIEVTAEVQRSHDTFTARSTNIRGKTFTAEAVEFADIGEPANRIALRVHPFEYSDSEIHTCLINGKVSISIGHVTLWMPEGYEVLVAAALNAAIEEQFRQAESGTEENVVAISGDDPMGFRGWDNDDDDDEVAA